jgi:CRISPR-associated endonuclease Csn1
MAKQAYRLGLDLGTNSIGWCILDLKHSTKEPCRIRATGVRIFSDSREAKSKTTLASARRAARAMRRSRDRKINRKNRLLNTLSEIGLMPLNETERKQLQQKNPYELRYRALNERIELYELGRALFHLNQRRGFKSNRKTDKKSNENGKILSAIKELKEKLESEKNRTYGEFLYHKNKKSQLVRLRANAKQEYAFYPDRSIIEEEFNFIWSKQSEFHKELKNEDMKNQIKNIILFQRNLRKPVPGKCLFLPEENRCPKALPSFQLFRLYQNLTNLRIRNKKDNETKLTREEINTIIKSILTNNKESVKFDDLRKYLSDTNKSIRFTIELSGYIKEIDGEEIQNQIGRIEKRLKKSGINNHKIIDTWNNLELNKKDEIISSILDNDNDDELINSISKKLNINIEIAKQIIEIDTPNEYSRLSLKAIEQFLAEWKNSNEEYLPDYSEISKKLFSGHTWNIENGFEKLPYYGEILTRSTVEAPPGMITAKDTECTEWIANPTVHVALNQLRLIINTIIDKYGKPDEIVIELARELKNNKETKDKINKSQRNREADYNESREEIINLGGNPKSRDDLIKWRLWKELPPQDRICIYTGKTIPQHKLFTNEIEVDHIIPFSRSLDDHISNKVLVFTQANRAKANKTPYEAFGNSPTQLGINFNWNEITNNVYSIFARTNTETGERFLIRKGNNILRENWNQEIESKFLARHLVDTQYLSKASMNYLKCICDNVTNTPGILTALIRRNLGLDAILSENNSEKNRLDHRHHAVDAFVIALTTRSYVQKISQANARREAEDPQNFVNENPLTPWNNYWIELKTKIDRLTVSHKSDHGYYGAMMEDTAYGIIDGPNKDGKYTTQIRVRIEDLKNPDLVIDESFKSTLIQLKEQHDNKWDLALKRFMANPPKQFRKLKSIKIKEENVLLLPPIKNKEGKPYKGYVGGNNAKFVIYEKPDGTWVGTTVSVYSAYLEDKKSIAPFETIEFENLEYKKLMELFKNDLVSINTENGVVYQKVLKFSQSDLTLCNPEMVKDREKDENGKLQFFYTAKKPHLWQKFELKPCIQSPLGTPRIKNESRTMCRTV